MPTVSIRRTLIVPAGLCIAVTFGACGSSSDEKVKNVQHQATQLQQQGQDIQEAAKKAAADVKAGRKTAAEANAELQKKTAELERKAKATASDAIDAVKDQSGVPDEAKNAHEDAQQQISTTP
jgi:outer membrane murein-binding lipoprotein Lpp